MKRPAAMLGFLCLCLCLFLALSATAGVDKLTYHVDAARRGWNDREVTLTPRAVASSAFGRLWNSPRFDAVNGVPARLFASPLYVDRVWQSGPGSQRGFHSVVYAAATSGYVYAINAFDSGPIRAGAILWRARLTQTPCGRATLGILATPVIDRRRSRLYVTVCEHPRGWSVHALELGTGQELAGWPLALAAADINRPGTNANGGSSGAGNHFPDGVANLQRGALNLSPDGSRLYVTFGGEPVSGWLLGIDTRQVRIVGAFSATARSEEGVGGMWASGGAAVDARGTVFVSTGSSVVNALAGRGVEGVYPDSEGNWGQSILALASRRSGGFELLGTYTPFDYCLAGARDLDLGSGTPVLIDLPQGSSRTTHLLALGGSKQGNAYLLDRDHFPGSLIRRQPCAADASADGSLLAPQMQPPYGTRGPLNVFGPYSTAFGMGDLAKSRSTAAYYRDAGGRDYLFASGSAKAAENSPVSVAPGLARLRIVTPPAERAYLQVDRSVEGLVLQNPGSPVVSSHGSRDAIVWLLDANKPRSASLYGANAPAPVLYAVDAVSLTLLWRSAPGELYPSGKYNEPAVVRGTVFVGTDRIQAFGIRKPGAIAAAADVEDDGAKGPAEAAAAPTAPTAPMGGAAGAVNAGPIYQQRCSPCHDVVREGVPLRMKLMGLEPQAIVEKLKFGSMQPQALGLDDVQIDALAGWLTAQ